MSESGEVRTFDVRYYIAELDKLFLEIIEFIDEQPFGFFDRNRRNLLNIRLESLVKNGEIHKDKIDQMNAEKIRLKTEDMRKTLFPIGEVQINKRINEVEKVIEYYSTQSKILYNKDTINILGQEIEDIQKKALMDVAKNLSAVDLLSNLKFELTKLESRLKDGEKQIHQ